MSHSVAHIAKYWCSMLVSFDPRRWNVTTSMVRLKKHIRKNSPKIVNPRDTAGNAEEDEEEFYLATH